MATKKKVFNGREEQDILMRMRAITKVRDWMAKHKDSEDYQELGEMLLALTDIFSGGPGCKVVPAAKAKAAKTEWSLPKGTKTEPDAPRAKDEPPWEFTFPVYEYPIRVGDVVMMKHDSSVNRFLVQGRQGVAVSRQDTVKDSMGVDWFDPVPTGHSCEGRAHQGHGWYVHESAMQIIWRDE